MHMSLHELDREFQQTKARWMIGIKNRDQIIGAGEGVHTLYGFVV